MTGTGTQTQTQTWTTGVTTIALLVLRTGELKMKWPVPAQHDLPLHEEIPVVSFLCSSWTEWLVVVKVKVD